jgi:serine/threonine protein kinase
VSGSEIIDERDSRIAGRYLITDLLSAGGSATVWAAIDELLDREVAIKHVVSSPWLGCPECEPVRHHALREARTACRINHPNVVNIYDVVEQDQRLWIIMQLVKAPSLAQLIERRGPCTPRHAARIGLQILGALRAVHANGITHRDVKPSNVLVDGEHALLTDFGIASSDGETTPNLPGTLVGAPSYIPPECIHGTPAGAASDLWSFGAMLYAAVEGRPPHRRDDAAATLNAVATEEPDPTRRAGMLAPLLTELLRKEPAKRPDSAKVERNLRRLVRLSEAMDGEPAPTAAGGSPAGGGPGGGPAYDETTAVCLPARSNHRNHRDPRSIDRRINIPQMRQPATNFAI